MKITRYNFIKAVATGLQGEGVTVIQSIFGRLKLPQ